MANGRRIKHLRDRFGSQDDEGRTSPSNDARSPRSRRRLARRKMRAQRQEARQDRQARRRGGLQGKPGKFELSEGAISRFADRGGEMPEGVKARYDKMQQRGEGFANRDAGGRPGMIGPPDTQVNPNIRPIGPPQPPVQYDVPGQPGMIGPPDQGQGGGYQEPMPLPYTEPAPLPAPAPQVQPTVISIGPGGEIIGNPGQPGMIGPPQVGGQPGMIGPPQVGGQPGMIGPPAVGGQPGMIGPPQVGGQPGMIGPPQVLPPEGQFQPQPMPAPVPPGQVAGPFQRPTTPRPYVAPDGQLMYR